MKVLTLEEIETKTLGEVSNLFRTGQVSRETAEQYCELWNTTTFRFTYAKVLGNSIVQRLVDPKELKG